VPGTYDRSLVISRKASCGVAEFVGVQRVVKIGVRHVVRCSSNGHFLHVEDIRKAEVVRERSHSAIDNTWKLDSSTTRTEVIEVGEAELFTGRNVPAPMRLLVGVGNLRHLQVDSLLEDSQPYVSQSAVKTSCTSNNAR
jgi:hypothetical protein